MPNFRIARLAVVGVALVGALGACGGDDSGEAEATTTTADLGAPLEAAVLTPEDLASDDPLDAAWVVGDVSAGVDIELPACVLEEPPAGALASAEARLVTQNDLKLPSLEEDVSVFEGSGAADAFAAAGERLDSCDPTFVFGGTPSVGAIDRLALTLPGEQSAAWRTTVTIAGTGVAITNIHIQDGDHELALTHVDLGEPNPAVLEGYATLALSKLG
ncbi:MAG: hypothetical protein M3Z03_13715 [Actinomycetota bacterium]|nr:hypothetical protein [Actinomycetota bacterium]